MYELIITYIPKLHYLADGPEYQGSVSYYSDLQVHSVLYMGMRLFGINIQFSL